MIFSMTVLRLSVDSKKSLGLKHLKVLVNSVLHMGIGLNMIVFSVVVFI